MASAPAQVPLAIAAGVQAAVTVTLSGVEPQVENEDGDTVIVIRSG